ncbi:bacterioferritin [Suttonella ornithocola]|uniref:Bacterioferritin n=1 Tax=Suttonella ornithocola TaxID=279832 RepID=A0A380MKG1_9GAMM|nr:bacterioferritin [Suttonella ornithocola]SUO93149.1 Bacterioferritin [Suttonella ornithocola]
MKTQTNILSALNAVLRHELTVINQYFLHARMLNNWGYDEVGERMYKQSIHAMKNADALIARIFFLEGLPNLQDLGKLMIGETVSEALECDLKVATANREAQQKAISLLEEQQDYVSRELLKKQMETVEDYIDWLEEQLGLIEEIGLPNYLQSAIEQDD